MRATGKYKGYDYEIKKIDDVVNKPQWYFKVGNEGGNDWFMSKKTAIKAMKDLIDNNFYKQ
jgi:hypothetical protein